MLHRRAAALLSGAELWLILAAAVACSGDKPTVDDDRMESYCQALCTWAADCAAESWADGAASTDRDTLFADCISDTRTVSAPCADAEEGTLNAAQQTTLEDCTAEIAAWADAGDRCAEIAGTASELLAAAPPEECSSQSNADATFRTAQDAVAEPGALLCDRLFASVCATVETCAASSTTHTTTLAGLTLGEACVAALATAAGSCQSDGRLDHGTALNPDREAAQVCLGELEGPACDSVLAGELGADCSQALGGEASIDTLTSLLDSHRLAGE